MARLRVGAVTCDADLVAFDKDGTLLDFEYMWGELLRAQVASLAGADEALAQALFCDIGYEVASRRTRPDGPWAMATMEQVLTVMAATLYRHGSPWPQADEAVHSSWRRLTTPERLAGLVRPTADIVTLFEGLRRAGVRTAVLTTDTRESTEQALRVLGIAGLTDSVVCSDDGLPAKPAPEQVWSVCRRLGVAVGRVCMVGDTVFDLLMGRRAGAGLTAGVLTGAGTRETLAPEADVIIESVGEISVAA